MAAFHDTNGCIQEISLSWTSLSVMSDNSTNDSHSLVTNMTVFTTAMSRLVFIHKGLSMVSQGISSLNCVWRWQAVSVLLSDQRIMISYGEKVCIMWSFCWSSSAFASLNLLRISSFVISVGFHTNSNGRTPLLFNSLNSLRMSL